MNIFSILPWHKSYLQAQIFSVVAKTVQLLPSSTFHHLLLQAPPPHPRSCFVGKVQIL